MIRPLKKEDINKVIAIELDTLGETLGYDNFNLALDNRLSYYFVYEKNNEVIGYISTSFDGEIVEVLNFCIDKNFQHQGIGSEILNYIIDYFTKNEAKSFILEVRDKNINAIKIYEKFGFIKIHTRRNYYNNGDDALVLERKL